MSNVLQNNEPIIQIEFKCRRHKQKQLIHALLQCSQLNLERIAIIIDVPFVVLANVYRGDSFLDAEQSMKLAQLFIICFDDWQQFQENLKHYESILF